VNDTTTKKHRKKSLFCQFDKQNRSSSRIRFLRLYWWMMKENGKIFAMKNGKLRSILGGYKFNSRRAFTGAGHVLSLRKI
jgi:hypothetical protein